MTVWWNSWIISSFRGIYSPCNMRFKLLGNLVYKSKEWTEVLLFCIKRKFHFNTQWEECCPCHVNANNFEPDIVGKNYVFAICWRNVVIVLHVTQANSQAPFRKFSWLLLVQRAWEMGKSEADQRRPLRLRRGSTLMQGDSIWIVICTSCQRTPAGLGGIETGAECPQNPLNVDL